LLNVEYVDESFALLDDNLLGRRDIEEPLGALKFMNIDFEEI